MPSALWGEMMSIHFPNVKWLALPMNAFEKLYALKGARSFTTMEKCIEWAIDRALEKIETKETEHAG
jgi:hypothetical protein